LEHLPALPGHDLRDRPGIEFLVDGHLFSGNASKVKRAATSAMRPAPLVMTTKLITVSRAKMITPMT
jgi:hypothetical protein